MWMIVFGVVFTLEHPEWRTRRVDLDPTIAAEASADELDDMAAAGRLVPADTAWVPELREVLRRA